MLKKLEAYLLYFVIVTNPFDFLQFWEKNKKEFPSDKSDADFNKWH